MKSPNTVTARAQHTHTHTHTHAADPVSFCTPTEWITQKIEGFIKNRSSYHWREGAEIMIMNHSSMFVLMTDFGISRAIESRSRIWDRLNSKALMSSGTSVTVTIKCSWGFNEFQVQVKHYRQHLRDAFTSYPSVLSLYALPLMQKFPGLLALHEHEKLKINIWIYTNISFFNIVKYICFNLRMFYINIYIKKIVFSVTWSFRNHIIMNF